MTWHVRKKGTDLDIQLEAVRHCRAALLQRIHENVKEAGTTLRYKAGTIADLWRDLAALGEYEQAAQRFAVARLNERRRA